MTEVNYHKTNGNVNDLLVFSKHLGDLLFVVTPDFCGNSFNILGTVLRAPFQYL